MALHPIHDRDTYDEIAFRALADYGLEGLSFTFIQHSENITYRVRKPDSSSYLLRIHIPVVPDMGNHGSDARAVKSELLWLEALRHETDLPVQMPLRNLRQQLVSQIMTDGNEPINCSILEWLEGNPYENEDESEYTAAQIGMMVGKLHTFSSHWHLPAGFIRPKRDQLYFEQSLKALEPALQDGRIGYADFKQLETSTQILSEMLQDMEKSRHTEGLLHGDLHRGNFIYQDGRVKLIDFSYCAFGNFILDVAICLSDMKKEYHSVFLKNYQTIFQLPTDYKRLIEAFFLGSSIGTFALLVNNPLAQETLVYRVPVIAREYAARFNDGESFWF